MSESEENKRAESSSRASNSTICPVKHPLGSKWTLWYYLPEKNKEWDQCQHKIHDVDTVEDFWSFVDHLKQPTKLISGVDYSFFKNGILPMWEEEQNREGGRMTVINTSKAKNANGSIDEIWLDVLLFLIGEYFDGSNDVCGAVLNVRQYGFKLAVWTKHSDKDKITAIGNSLKRSICPPLSNSITFERHKDTQRSSQTSGRASAKALFII